MSQYQAKKSVPGLKMCYSEIIALKWVHGVSWCLVLTVITTIMKSVGYTYNINDYHSPLSLSGGTDQLILITLLYIMCGEDDRNRKEKKWLMRCRCEGTWSICTRLSVRRRAWALRGSCRPPSTAIAEKVDAPAIPTVCTATPPPRALLHTHSSHHQPCKALLPDTMAWIHPPAQFWRKSQVWHLVHVI